MRDRGAHRATVDSFFRRQLVLAAATGIVVLVGLLAVTALLDAGQPGAATWAAGAVLVAVLVALVLGVAHVVGVARFTLPRSGRDPSSKEGEQVKVGKWR